ncbi:MAG: type IX secretion system membrane protein PorP/SprF [Chitinophagaceae bacterium]|nr:MAG: type IX secretion system membrane protein PorP/SprF [Chitinophagaceae bacterium]
MKKVFSVLFFSFLFFSLRSQDLHFSQAINTPVFTNPAFTGLYDGEVRVGLIYRDQWQSISGFRTFGAATDLRIIGAQRGNRFFWSGIGLYVLTDQGGGGLLNTTKVGASLGLHFSASDNTLISLGFQAGNTQRSVNFSDLTFSTQSTGNGFDPGIQSLEPPQGFTNISYLEYNAGINLRQVIQNDQFAFNIGGSVFRFNNPTESFYSDFEGKEISERQFGFNGLLGFEISPTENFDIIPFFMYRQQDMYSQILGMLIFQIHIQNFILAPGSAYRHEDAVIPYMGFYYRNAKLGISYDINISELSTASNMQGGPEISLSYTANLEDFGINTRRSGIRQVPCPKW